MSDLLPAVDGLFLGETTTPRRWDGSKLINLPAAGGGKSVLGLGFIILYCMDSPYEHQYSPMSAGNLVTGNTPTTFQTPIIAGTLTKMKVRVTDMNDFGINVPIYVQKNGVNTAATVTIPVGVTNTTYTWSGSVSVAENDRLNLHYDILGAAGYEVMYLTISFEFQPS